MKLSVCLAAALAAGSVVSVASAQQELRVRSMTPVQLGDHVTVNGRQFPVHQVSGHSDGVQVYASGDLTTYLADVPGAVGDHCLFTPGPGAGGPVTVDSVDYISLGCSATAGWPGGHVDLVVEFWDTIDPTIAPPDSIISGPIMAIAFDFGELPALTAGQFYYTTAPVDISSLNLVLPDDDFTVVQYVIVDGSDPAQVVPELMAGFSNVDPTVGASEPWFLMDANNDGVFTNDEGFVFTSGNPANLTLRLTGHTPGGNSCYANCDQSTAEPRLNANDFQCFLNAYATASTLPNDQQITSYANCDASTGDPALNANDFQCFLNSFAVGCS
jgi:hypothetical protein